MTTLSRDDMKNIYAYLRIAQLRAQRIAERATSPDVRLEQLRRCRELTRLLEKISGNPIDPPIDPDAPPRPQTPTLTKSGRPRKPRKDKGMKRKGGEPHAPQEPT